MNNRPIISKPFLKIFLGKRSFVYKFKDKSKEYCNTAEKRLQEIKEEIYQKKLV
jgi:hypothetical protein